MKRILYALVALVAVVGFTSCEKGNKGKLDPSAKVYISAAQTPQTVAASTPQSTSKAAQTKLTPRQVVEQAQGLRMSNGTMDIDDWNRDLENIRFRGVGTWVIAQSGDLYPDFITARDAIIVTKNAENRPKDTIAYLPNAIMIEAEKKIRAAYAAEDYAACYTLFENAWVFTPITGAEWLALKAKGEN